MSAGGCGKIPKPSKSSPGGLCRRQSFGVIFENFGTFFSKNQENTKNGKNSKKNKNEAGAMYCLIYIFFQILLLTFKFSKTKSEFLSILKKSVGFRYPPSMGLM